MAIPVIAKQREFFQSNFEGRPAEIASGINGKP